MAADIPENLQVKFDLKNKISPLSEKKEILDADHIYILPTLKEPFGMSVIEASARGNMIVPAETNGPSYMFESSEGEDTSWGIVTRYGVLAHITDNPPLEFSGNIGEAVKWTSDNWSKCTQNVIEFNKKYVNTGHGKV